MHLDFFTLYAVGTVALTVTALFVAFASRSYAGDLREVGHLWAKAVFVSALGYAFVGLRGRLPDGVSILAAHGTGVAASCAYWHACLRFTARRVRTALIYSPALAAVASAAWFYLVVPNRSVRVAVFSLLCALPLALAARALAPRSGSLRQSNSRAGSVAFGALAVLFLFRAAAQIGEDPGVSAQANFAGSRLEQAAILLILVGFSILSFLFLVLANGQLTSELEHLAMLDSLTERFNRRAILGIARRELARSHRLERPLAVAVVDVDRFKSVNDLGGHAAGDAALVALSALLAGSVRAHDAVGRLGGDEFLLVLPEATGEEARVVCERLRTEVRKLESGSGENSQRAMTVSIGIAETNGERSSLEALMSAADAALYGAKDRGRDCVVCAPG